MKAWTGVLAGKPLTPTVSYLGKFSNSDRVQWVNTPAGIISGFQAAATG